MRIFIPLTIEEQNRLRALAERERRRPADQAALIVAKALAEEEPAEMVGQKAVSTTARNAA